MSQDQLMVGIQKGVEMLFPELEEAFGVVHGNVEEWSQEMRDYILGQVSPAQREFDLVFEANQGKLSRTFHSEILSLARGVASNLKNVWEFLEEGCKSTSLHDLTIIVHHLAHAKVTFDHCARHIESYVHNANQSA